MPRFAPFVWLTSLLIFGIALLVLFGWQFNIVAFTTILPGLVGMNPFTALSFCAIVGWQLLYLRSTIALGRLFYAMRLALAVFVLLVGGLRLIDILAGTDYGLDNLLSISSLAYGFISPITAFSFTLLAIVMLLEPYIKRLPNGVLFLLTPVFLLSICSLFGYFTGDNDIFTIKPFRPMALHTTVCFLALVASFLVLFPQNVFTRTVLANDSGGLVARRLLPYLLVAPMALGFLSYQGERLGLYDTGFGVAIVVVGALLTFLVVVVHQSNQLSLTDQQRSAAENKVREHAQEVESANRELERRNNELEQFTYVSHHDLQEPLRKLILFSDLVKTDSYDRLTPTSQRNLDRILAAAYKMRASVRDVLEFAALDRKDTLAWVDLTITVDAVKGDLEAVIQEKAAVIQSQRLPNIKAVADQMHQLFYHLLSNALTFSTEDRSPVITLACKTVDEDELLTKRSLVPNKSYYEITITDNGIGFGQEVAEKIFGLFQRAHQTSGYSGTGIGLALCKKIVENRGGKIWAEGRPGEGATFHVLLPME